jgi:hypothetical protein
MIEPFEKSGWKFDKVSKVWKSVVRNAPKVADEILAKDARKNVLLSVNGLLHPSTELKMTGPAFRAHLDTFSEKMAMAAFREICGRPIEMNGIIFTEWYLNSGIPIEAYHACLNIMPMFGQLEQGKKNSSGQFSLIYNTNERSLIGGVSFLQNGLSILFFATDGEEYIKPLGQILSDFAQSNRPTSQVVKPGLEKIGTTI